MDYEKRVDFPSLSPAVFAPATETSQRFLASAYDSVEDLFDWHQSADDLAVDDQREDPDLGARTRESAQDMLRSMIVFAGAGVDAVTKQLVRETLETMVSREGAAAQKFTEFVEASLDPGRRGNVKRLANYLLSSNPRQILIEDYVHDLTGSSLQSVAQLERVLISLGIVDRTLSIRCKNLRPLFVARNEIVHELDLVQPNTPGDRHRRTRTKAEAVNLAHSALEFAQQIINAVGQLLADEGK